MSPEPIRPLLSDQVAITTPEYESTRARHCGPTAEALLAHSLAHNRRSLLRADPVGPRGQTGPNLELVTLNLASYCSRRAFNY